MALLKYLYSISIIPSCISLKLLKGYNFLFYLFFYSILDILPGLLLQRFTPHAVSSYLGFTFVFFGFYLLYV
jgi:hypothetical protein